MMILIPITFQEETDLIFETKVKKGRSDTIWRKKVLQEGLRAKKKIQSYYKQIGSQKSLLKVPRN